MNGRSRTAVDELIDSPLLAENTKKAMDETEAVLSDLHFTVDAMLAEADTVALFCTLHGAHTGEYGSPWITAPPSGKDVAMSCAYLFRCDNGRIRSVLPLVDLQALLVQITADIPYLFLGV
jgi:predicted ester cyclase